MDKNASGRTLAGGTAWALAGVVALVVWLYVPSLNFGLFWDDPKWFRQGLGQSLAQLLAGSPSFQFYRPAAIWYFARFWDAGGSLHVQALHLAQVAWHLAATCLVVVLARHWRLPARTQFVAGLLFASFPFSQQAVAWAAPQQPMVTCLILLALIILDCYLRRKNVSWMILCALVYAVALFVQEIALPMYAVLASTAIAHQGDGPRGGSPRRRWAALALLALVAAVYLALWWRAPRLAGVTGEGMDLRVADFFAQAVVFPVARLLAILGVAPPPGMMLGLATAFGLGFLWLTASNGKGGRSREIVLMTWILAVFAPMWLGLSWDYVEVGQRLAYAAAPAVALAWAIVLTNPRAAKAGRLPPTLRDGMSRRLMAGSAVVVFAWTLADSVQLVQRQNDLMRTGADHLRQAVHAHRAPVPWTSSGPPAPPPRRLVFINFPDRYHLQPAPYPLGLWGVTLAPVALSLADFATSQAGPHAASESWSVPAVGAADRSQSQWPLAVDMRGVSVDPARLLEIAKDADQLYLSNYADPGRRDLGDQHGPAHWPLRPVGRLAPGARSVPTPGPSGRHSLRSVVSAMESDSQPVLVGGTATDDGLAEFGSAARLVTATLGLGAEGDIEVRSAWQRRGRGPDAHTTLFVHVFAAEGNQVAGADGDTWGGLLPLAGWPPERIVEDIRPIIAGRLEPGRRYLVTIGLYQRDSGAKLPLQTARRGVRGPYENELSLGWIVRDANGVNFLTTP